MAPPAQASSFSISSNFNGTNITVGNFIWFNAHLTSVPNATGQLFFTGMQIFVDDPTPGEDRTYSVPNSVVTFLAGTGTQTTSFNSALDLWETTIYTRSSAGDPFMAGLAALPDVNHVAANRVTWSGTVTTPDASLRDAALSWQWAAAVYTCFGPYDDAGIAAVDKGVQSGAPVAYEDCVVGGARGGGGSNYTGSNSGTASLTPSFDDTMTMDALVRAAAGPVLPSESEIPSVPEPATLLLVGTGAAIAARRLVKR